MRRHREVSELHRFLLSYAAKSTTIGRPAQGLDTHGCRHVRACYRVKELGHG